MAAVVARMNATILAMIIVSATAWWAMPTLQIQVVDFMSFVGWALPTIPYRLAACGPNDDQGHDFWRIGMTTMIKEVYEAFKAAGVDEEKAGAAAKALTELREESRLRGIEDRLTKVESDLKLLRWMVGFNLALTAAVLLKLLV